MEGWYYRLTIPEESVSFAFIISTEDAGTQSDIRLNCIQVIGPDDGYLIQADRETEKFWAWKHQQGLGCTFEWEDHVVKEESRYWTALIPTHWDKNVKSGFQILPNRLLGKIHGHDGSRGILEGQGEPGSCYFNFEVTPLCGWGDQGTRQKSTAGWLASFDVFEPHWQVTLADARATGVVVWNGHSYNFTDAAFYAEKNWGASLPSKWYWTQCNTFQSLEQCSVTAGGGIRSLPFGRKEALGMVCVHYQGKLYEAVPWSGSMEWSIEPWGSWSMKGNSTLATRPFEVLVEFECHPDRNPGLVFRAPTPDEGMVYFCKDTFNARCTLSLWELEWDPHLKIYSRKKGPPLIDRATSDEGGAEVGGGPWWQSWNQHGQVKQPIRFLLRVPQLTMKLFTPLHLRRRDRTR